MITTLSRSSRDLNDLLINVKYRAIAAIAAAELRTGLKIIVTCTYRSNEEQKQLYDQGRITEGKIVTNDPGPNGPHAMRIALDIAPAIKDNHGIHIWWETPKWSIIAEAFKEQGFEWGGDWKRPDRPHFQFVGNKTISELRKMGQNDRNNYIIGLA